MDVLSHALYGSAPFLSNKNKKYFWFAFLIGITPDALSFGIFMVLNLLGIYERPDWQSGPPPVSAIPEFVSILYDITHSLVIFALVFISVWIIRRKPFWPLLAWGIHILVDIPSHSDQFFPTPFLWPVSDFHLNGISWGSPVIFFPNWILIVLIYGGWFLWKRYKKKSV